MVPRRTHGGIGLKSRPKLRREPHDSARSEPYVPRIVRSQRGQTAAEYLGALLVISVVVAAIATTNLGTQITTSMHRLVCTIAGQDCGAPPANAAQLDTDGDGVLDGDDPVPDHSDIDGDG